MSDEELNELLEELHVMALEAHCEAHAVAELLVEKGIFTLAELVKRRSEIIDREYQELEDEAKRRAFEALLKGRPKQ